MFQHRVAASPERPAFLRKVSGAWTTTSWREFHDAASRLATFLLDHGIAQGDKIAIVGGTRPEWCICDMGGLLAGAVMVGAYTSLTADQLGYIVDHCDARIVFVEDRAQLEKIKARRASLPKVELVIVWDMGGVDREKDDVVALDDALKTEPDKARIEARVAEARPEDTAIIVYTSGTTGPPKGAMLSHKNILVVLRGASIVDFDEDDVSLSFLPMAHVAERVASFYGRIDFGVVAAYATSVQTVLEELKEVRPTVFGSVPRIFEKAYARIQSEVAKASPMKQRVFRFAESVGARVVAHWQAGEPLPLVLRLQHKLVDRLIFSKLREAFGGRVRLFLTGAAPTPRRVLDFFWGAGLPIYEMYGMTEATVITHANRPGEIRLGTVGKAVAFVEEKLAEDGEILIRGETVFQGYYKDPEATAATVDAEGWLHTGDIGKRDERGYLSIVDRKKHIIITAGGKNLTPANIEGAIKVEDPLISQVHAHGDTRSHVTALVTVHPIEAVDFAKERGLVSAEEAARLTGELMQNPLARPTGLAAIMEKVTTSNEVRDRITAAVRRGNEKLSRVEQVKRVYLLDRDFSLDDDEVTPTLKVKRKNVEKAFASVFDRLYDDPSFGIVVQER